MKQQQQQEGKDKKEVPPVGTDEGGEEEIVTVPAVAISPLPMRSETTTNATSSGGSTTSTTTTTSLRKMAIFQTLLMLGVAVSHQKVQIVTAANAATSADGAASSAYHHRHQQQEDLILLGDDSSAHETALELKSPGYIEVLDGDGHDYDEFMDSLVDDDDNDDDEEPPPSYTGSKDDIIVVVAVDGTMAGISKSTGQILWRQSGTSTAAGKDAPRDSKSQSGNSARKDDQSTEHGNADPYSSASASGGSSSTSVSSYPSATTTTGNPMMKPRTKNSDSGTSKGGNRNDESRLLQPLISTTTTTKSASSSEYAAVPSVDGTVYMSTSAPKGGLGGGNPNGGDVTVSTSVKDLVARAPFLDARGKFYVGSRHSTVAAVDGATGRVLRVLSAQGADGQSLPADMYNRTASEDGDEEDDEVGENTVWIGRVDYAVSVQDARTGRIDVQFSVAEVMSVSDMQGLTDGDQAWNFPAASAASASASTTSRPGRRSVVSSSGFDGHIQSLPSSADGLNDNDTVDLEENDDTRLFDGDVDDSVWSEPVHTQSSSALVATPSGNLAFRDLNSGSLQWVADESFDTPIAFAMDAASGLPLAVDIIPDVPVPNSSPEYLSREIERQLELLDHRHREQFLDGGIGAGAGQQDQTIVGSMKSGQLYALPLGGAGHLSPVRHGSESPPQQPPPPPLGHPQRPVVAAAASSVSATANSATSSSSATSSLGMQVPQIGSGRTTKFPSNQQQPQQRLEQQQQQPQQHHHHHQGQQTKKPSLLDGEGHALVAKTTMHCDPSLPNFESCIAGHNTQSQYHHFYQQYQNSHHHQNLRPQRIDYLKGMHNNKLLPDGKSPSAVHGNHPTNNADNGQYYETSDVGYDGTGNSLIVSNANPFHGDDGVNYDEPMFYHPEYGYISPQLFQEHVHHQQQHQAAGRSKYNKLLRILGSWLPPTIALIFVLSFELGRRKRLKDNQSNPESNTADAVDVTSDLGLQNLSGDLQPYTQAAQQQQQQQQQLQQVAQQQHVIQVSDEVLGYGGQGTVVYKGVLDGRDVAVKRLLQTYHASADREISLLIESDGHPNVVRYFLKEMRGDFVYLALELCDLSLHDLIAVLRQQEVNRRLAAVREADRVNGAVIPSLKKTIPASTRSILQQIASGVKHLHSLRIVHRDLKPANILLAISKRGKKVAAKKNAENETSVYDTFENGFYVAKISDMGLGKQLVGQSSLGVSMVADSSFRGGGGAGKASSVGIGPGSVGWQAPEVMALRLAASDASVRSETNSVSNGQNPDDPNSNNGIVTGNGNNNNNDPTAPNPRTSRSVDIFSLGCIFYSTLVPGFHPFGDWYEREANIMHNRPTIGNLQELSVDAFDLVSAMLNRNPKLRPTAKQICEHPFFWLAQKKATFLCEFSDRLETDATAAEAAQPQQFMALSKLTMHTLAIERGAVDVVGTSWDKQLDENLINNMQRFRTYDPSSVRDLLRLIRNKHHHFDELPSSFRTSCQVSDQDSLMNYFETCFPRLLMHCYNCCRQVLEEDDALIVKYAIPPHPSKVLAAIETNSKGGIKAQDAAVTDTATSATTSTPVASTKNTTSESKPPIPTIVSQPSDDENDEVVVVTGNIGSGSGSGNDTDSHDANDDKATVATTTTTGTTTAATIAADEEDDGWEKVPVTRQAWKGINPILNPAAAAKQQQQQQLQSTPQKAPSPPTFASIAAGKASAAKPSFAAAAAAAVAASPASTAPSSPRPPAQVSVVPPVTPSTTAPAPAISAAVAAIVTPNQLIPPNPVCATVPGAEDIIVWEGSTAAKAFNCRGWSRSEDEWSRRIDPWFRKKDPNLKRAAEDTKFRTRLCNHWDVSLGTFCPMRKKNKCVFAHGPVELRVKEGKRNRWGRLVDKNGDNSNPWHSGGEDTYGAAKSIESVRKEEGKWNTNKNNSNSNNNNNHHGGAGGNGNNGRRGGNNKKGNNYGGNNNNNNNNYGNNKKKRLAGF